MSSLLLEIARNSLPDEAADLVRVLAQQADWSAFCTLVHRSRLAALCYKALRTYGAFVPADVLEWLRVQHYETTGVNLFLLAELGRITERFKDRSVAFLALKGLVVAQLGLGFHVRAFSDLDLLIRRQDLESGGVLLRDLGYQFISGPPHPFHLRYARVGEGWPVVELHFDLVDRDRAFTPDVKGIWERANEVDLQGLPVASPALTDHLLLLMMQLPHHHWAPRLLLDIAHIVHRWHDALEWGAIASRSRSWRIGALVGSTLAVLTSMLGVIIPPQGQTLAEPEGYFRRLQWGVVRAAVSEQFAGVRPLASRIAPYLIADDPANSQRLLARRIISRNERWPSRSRVPALPH